MEEINLKEMKKIQIQILNQINNFCQKNKINYWLDCGTLIGAARHKGYIPWDDDIDIGMLREDYDRFMNTFNKANRRYKLLCIEKDKNYYFAYGKVIDTKTVLYEPDEETGVKSGVYIDVFVYDNAPDNPKLADKMFKKRDLYNKMRMAQLYKDEYDHTSIKKRIIRFFLNLYLKFLPIDYYTRKIVENSKTYMHENTKRIGNFTSTTKFMADKKLLRSFIKLEFEGKKYPVPIGYDEWLHNFYGDYMQLPPKEKRVSHHVFKAYKLTKKEKE